MLVKLTGAKHALHKAVKGLKEEFPGLAHVAHMALNPLGLAVAGIARLTPLRLQERLPVVASCLAVGLGTVLLIQRLLPA